MHDLVAKQRTYFQTQQTKDIAFRRKQLDTLKQLLNDNEELLYEAIYSDFKKSKFDTYTSELSLLYQDIDDAKKHIYKWSRKQKVKTDLINFPGTSFVQPEPLGVALVIGAWNYPYQLSLAPVIAAMAAGNTIVLKPSELPARTSAVMAQLINSTFSSEYFHVVDGGVPETTELLNQKFDKIFFTGSTKVGKIVYKAAAENLTPVTLEMGGKSPAFISEDCNVKMSVKRLVWAKFLNAGQTCIAPDYVMVDKKVKDQFLTALVDEISSQQFAFENDNYVQIINNDHVERLQGLMEDANIYYGGTVSKTDRYIEPTVLRDVTFEDAVMQEEIFGPILPVIEYDTLDEAIHTVAQLPKPLSCYVFTNKRSEREAVLKKLSFGGGAVNDAVMHITNSRLPFGGVGDSGIGAYHGEAGFKAFSHYKGILKKPTWFELPIKYFPHTAGRFKLIKWISRFQ